MKRILSSLLSLLLCLQVAATFPAIATANAENDTVTTQLSKAAIKHLLDTSAITERSDWWDLMPSAAHWVPGSLKQEVQEAGLNRLNAWRKIVGVDPVSLKDDYISVSQYASLMESLLPDTIEHKPSKPVGMPDAFYEQAFLGSKNGNLTAGVTFDKVVDLLLSDRFGNNLATVGHRRWMLNPAMLYTGFGYTENANSRYRRFGVLYATDDSRDGARRDYVLFPSEGYFPNNTYAFTPTTPWSVSINTSLVGKLIPSEVTVQLTRESDGKVWNFSSANSYKEEDTGEWFTVSATGTGVSQAIIFRPEVESYEGKWSVICTVKDSFGGEPLIKEYSVEFFDTDTYDPTQDPTECWESGEGNIASLLPTVSHTFSDIPVGHWAREYINIATEDGAIQGYPDGTFKPAAEVTGYQLASIILRGCFGEDTTADEGAPWYSKVDELFVKYGLWVGLAVDGDFDKNVAITRYQMAQILYNTLVATNALPEVTTQFATGLADIYGSNYETAVTACVQMGILQGVDEKHFDGGTTMTRAQAAVVYTRLKPIIMSRSV